MREKRSSSKFEGWTRDTAIALTCRLVWKTKVTYVNEAPKAHVDRRVIAYSLHAVYTGYPVTSVVH